MGDFKLGPLLPPGSVKWVLDALFCMDFLCSDFFYSWNRQHLRGQGEPHLTFLEWARAAVGGHWYTERGCIELGGDFLFLELGGGILFLKAVSAPVRSSRLELGEHGNSVCASTSSPNGGKLCHQLWATCVFRNLQDYKCDIRGAKCLAWALIP